MNIAIIGMGFVGLTLALVLASKKINVYGIESDKTKLEFLNKGKSYFYEPKLDELLVRTLKSKKLNFSSNLKKIFSKLDVIFITVGTPTVKGKTDLKSLKKVIKNLGDLIKDSKNQPLLVIKSTIPPSTSQNVIIPLLEKTSKKVLGEDYFLATNPEFLQEGTAIDNQFFPHVIVIGTTDEKSKKLLVNLYKKIYRKQIPRFYTNYSVAELIKYANNAFLATKISFINSISNLCQQIPGGSIDDVAKVIGMDKRIGPLFLKAGPGYGGSCLPKDLDSIISTFKNYGIKPYLFEGVKQVNDIQINQIIKLLKTNINSLENKTISILGLSFKENSDDIRKSRSIKLIEKLLEFDCKLKVHDPKAISKTKEIFKDKLEYYSKIKDCLNSSDCAIIMTPWAEYKNLTKEFDGMKNKVIIDTRRILKTRNLKINYSALGIKDI